MLRTSWWKELIRRLSLRHEVREVRVRAGIRGRRLFLEGLEPRSLLATITVTSLADNSTADGHVTLREAIEAANTNASVDGSTAGEAAPAVDQIVFAPGLAGTISLVNFSTPLNAYLEITETVKIQGNGTANTIIDAHRDSRVLVIRQTSGDVTLDGVTITGGFGTAGNGAGILSTSTGILTITNSAVSGNSISVSGSGFYAVGGGIYSAGTVRVTNTTISGNSVTVAGSSIGEGGGIFADGDVTVSSSTIRSNSVVATSNSSVVYGGGIGADDLVTVINSTISDNLASGTGTNSPARGGGIVGSVTVTNSTVSGNTAVSTQGAAEGGGIYTSRTVTTTSSTITGNLVWSSSSSSQGGGGIFTHTGSATIRNSIVASNSNNFGGAPDLWIGDFTPELTVVQASLIGDNSGTKLTAAPVGTSDANGNLVGTPAAPIDPKLEPIANNGGPTQTHALLPGSPALDRGDNSLIPAEIATDQRGVKRIIGTKVDMGAFERQHRWHNPVDGLDVVGSVSVQVDRVVAANDALAVINYINASGSGAVPDDATATPPYYDTNDDDSVAADDVLAIINYINAFGSGGPGPAGEGEATVVSQPEVNGLSNDLLILLALDIPEQGASCRRPR